MTLFHHEAPPKKDAGKRRLSLFSFANKPAEPAASTSPQTPAATERQSVSSSRTRSGSSQFNSPTGLPVADASLADTPDCNIFERSVQDMTEAKQEDYIPPALDASAQILSDKDTNLEEVEMVYSLRRNLLVLGLNMALGRSGPLRKNSVYSMTQANVALQSSLLPVLPVLPPKLNSSRSLVSFFSYADVLSNDEFSRRPSFMHSYSHNGVPTARKMSVASVHSAASNSTSAAPGLTFNKVSRKGTLLLSVGLASQLLNQMKDLRVPSKKHEPAKKPEKEARSSNKFLISPESSDSEDHEPYYPQALARRSMSSGQSALESEIVSTSVADCIRECSTEISGH